MASLMSTVAEGSRDGVPPEPCKLETWWEIDPRVELAGRGEVYERRPGDPAVRSLRIYALDPAASSLEGAVDTVEVPYEPLGEGPLGTQCEVMPEDEVKGCRYCRVHLDDPALLMRDGRDPSPSDPQFHQQMVYAVCSSVLEAFRKALGRHVTWGFDRPGERDGRLRIRPHGMDDRNAFYDKQRGELRFGYYRADDEVRGRSLPGGYVFTCLSHDIVAHEVTHALLDGLRSHFTHPSGPDVLGFHEGFADLVAVFQHFTYGRLLGAAIGKCRGRLEQAELLTSLASQFGHTTGERRALRSALRVDAQGAIVPVRYDPTAEAHELGSVLVSAAFEAFTTRFTRKTARYVRLATGGTGVLPHGEIPADLQSILADEAAELARQFLQICIRAIDYCPPVDLEYGEFLRAVITADHDLVPSDPWGYREAWIDAFAKRRIYPERVASLSEDALLWQPPRRPIRIPELGYQHLRLSGDPANPASPRDLREQAEALARVVVLHLDQFGMAPEGHPRLNGDRVHPPRVQSVRTSRRVGPHGEVVFDLVAEVTQLREVRLDGETVDFYGGATVILGPRGEVRYVIAKSVLNEARIERQHGFMRGAGKRYWTRDEATLGWKPREKLFRFLHGVDHRHGEE